MQTTKKSLQCNCRRVGKKICYECQEKEYYEWAWDKEGTGSTVVFSNDDHNVVFNPGFSVGTVAVRGAQPFKKGYSYYWEIEMSTEVYGTDMMIGVGTNEVDLQRFSHHFVSFLGVDGNSWGLSYSGFKRHNGDSEKYCKQFGQHSIVGVHLDLWAGTLEYYLDKKPLGIAFNGLGDKELYPIVTSTAARSGMNLIFCRSYPSSLQLTAMLSLSKHLLTRDENVGIADVLNFPPGLKKQIQKNYWWIVSSRERERVRDEDLNNRTDSMPQFPYRNLYHIWPNTVATGRSRDVVFDEDENRLNLATDSDTPTTGFVIPPSSPSELDSNSSTSSDSSESEESASSAEPTKKSLLPKVDETPRGSEQELEQPEVNSNPKTSLALPNGTEFMGRISPIFIGMPEGGFSVLPNRHYPTRSVAAARSRSAPAQPSTSTGETPASNGKLTRPTVPSPPRSDEDDSSNDATPSARSKPKRLRLCQSDDGNQENEPN